MIKNFGFGFVLGILVGLLLGLALFKPHTVKVKNSSGHEVTSSLTQEQCEEAYVRMYALSTFKGRPLDDTEFLASFKDLIKFIVKNVKNNAVEQTLREMAFAQDRWVAANQSGNTKDKDQADSDFWLGFNQLIDQLKSLCRKK